MRVYEGEWEGEGLGRRGFGKVRVWEGEWDGKVRVWEGEGLGQ